MTEEGINIIIQQKRNNSKTRSSSVLCIKCLFAVDLEIQFLSLLSIKLVNKSLKQFLGDKWREKEREVEGEREGERDGRTRDRKRRRSKDLRRESKVQVKLVKL